MKPKCYCCGESLGERFVLVSYDSEPDRAFLMKLEHVGLVGDGAVHLNVVVVPCWDRRAVAVGTTLVEELEQAARRADFIGHQCSPQAVGNARSVVLRAEHAAEAARLRVRAERVRGLLAKHGLSEQHAICACGKCAACDLLAFLGTRWADGRPTPAAEWPRVPAAAVPMTTGTKGTTP